MKYTYSKALIWILIYVTMAMIPLAVALLGTIPDYRGFAMEVGVALGMLGLGILGLQFLFSGRIKPIAPDFGMDNILQFHREMGIVAFFFIVAHPLTIVVGNPDYLRYFNPADNLPRALALYIVTFALILITASSLWRIQFGLSYEKWRLLHGLLSLSIVFIGLVHTLQVSHYYNARWQQIFLVFFFGSFCWLLIHTRIIRPFKMRKKPYIITEIKEERNECWTIYLEPLGHRGMNYKCGQFVWITIGETPFF